MPDGAVDDLRARLEFGVTTRAGLLAAAFAAHRAARELLGAEAVVREDVVTSDGERHRGRITQEDATGLLLQPGARRFPQRSVLRVERDVERWLGDAAEPVLWASDLEAIGGQALARACVAAARLVLPRHAEGRPGDPTARSAVEAAEAWLRQATAGARAGAQEAARRADEAHGGRGPSAAWCRRLLARAEEEGVDTHGLRDLDPAYWCSALQDQLRSVPEADPETAWLACADAAWSCAPRETWPERLRRAGPLHEAARAAGGADVRRAIDAALLRWGLGDA